MVEENDNGWGMICEIKALMRGKTRQTCLLALTYMIGELCNLSKEKRVELVGVLLNFAKEEIIASAVGVASVEEVLKAKETLDAVAAEGAVKDETTPNG